MANPNELSKIMNEMAAALQELSDAQLDSVSSILSNEKAIVDKQKKVKKAQDKLEKEKKDLDKKSKKDNKKIIDKTLKQKEGILDSFDEEVYELKQRASKKKKELKSLTKRLGSGLVDGLGLRGTFDAYKSIKGALSDPKEFLKDRIFGTEDKSKISSVLTIKKDLVLSNSNINQMNIGLKGDLKLNGVVTSLQNTKQSQSLLNFDAETNDVASEQLDVLKTINDKLDHLGVTGSSGGLFDFLGNGLKDILSSALVTGGEVAAGGASTGILAKYGSKIPGIKKIGSIISKVPKSKAGLIAGAGTLALGAGAYGYNSMFGEEEKVEPRLEGGKVNAGKPYVVGEGGKELFVPDSNGSVLPNDKVFGKLSKEQFAKLGLFEKNRSSSFINDIKVGLDAYNKPITTSLSSYIKTQNTDYEKYKEDIKTSITSIFDILGMGWDNVADKVSGAYDYIKDKAKEFFNGDSKNETPTSSSTSTPQPKESKSDAPEKSMPGPLAQLKAEQSNQKVSVKNSYSIDAMPTQQTVSDDMKVAALIRGVQESVNFKEQYTPSTRSNILADTYGVG